MSVAPFSSLGVQAFATTTPKEIQQAFDEVLLGDYAVLLVTEEVYEVLEGAVARRIEEIGPAITVIPGAAGSTGAGGSRIDSIIDRALGTSLFTQKHADETDERK